MKCRTWSVLYEVLHLRNGDSMILMFYIIVIRKKGSSMSWSFGEMVLDEMSSTPGMKTSFHAMPH